MATTSNQDVSKATLLSQDQSTSVDVEFYQYPLNKLMIAVTAIIFTTFFNALAYYGISGSINLFLQTELSQDKATASINTTLFTGTRFFITIVGAVVADSFLGRFKTILFGLFVYIIGCVGVAILSIELSSKDIESVTSTEQILFWFALYLVAFGSGSIGPNNLSLGAEQFDYHSKLMEQQKYQYQTDKTDKNTEKDSKLSKYKESYFQWRYFSNNCATLVSYTVIAYLCQDVSFGIGYSIPALSIIIGTIVFALPSRLYHKFKPKGSILLRFCKILCHVTFNQKRKLLQYNPTEIQDVKKVIKIFPFWICYIIYWSVWSQLNTLIYAQGCQMNYRIESLNWNFPIAALSLFSIIPILILIPIFDRCLFPFLRKYNIQLTMLQKMGIGLIFAMLSMVCAAITEIIRRDYSSITDNKSICDSNDEQIYTSDLNIFWQIPAFFLEGVSEVFASVTGYEFFFNEAPKSMKSVMSAAYSMSIGLGAWSTGLYILLANIDKNNLWITDDLNDGHLDYYFFVVALLTLLAFIFFLWKAKKYEYRNSDNINGTVENDTQSELSKLSIMNQPVDTVVSQSEYVSLDHSCSSVKK